jgi:hypothetical protein
MRVAALIDINRLDGRIRAQASQHGRRTLTLARRDLHRVGFPGRASVNPCRRQATLLNADI